MSSALTNEGQTRINQLMGLEQPLIMDRMVLALIPGIDPTAAVDRTQQMPPAEQIVYDYTVPADYKGYVTPDQVVHSMILGSDVGNFSFNWIGLVEETTETVIAITHFPETPKWKTDIATNTTGNSITRNMMTTFVDAQNITGITVSAETWQFDYQAVLNLHANLLVDPTVTGVVKKHLTDTQAKKWEDHSNDTLLHMGRNVLINALFDIWQRGASQTLSGYGSDDRWKNIHIGSTKIHSRQAFAPGQTDVPGNPKYYSRTVVTSVPDAGNYVMKYQAIEGVQTLAGCKAILSFWARADSIKNMVANLEQQFGSGGAPSDPAENIGKTTIPLTSIWTKFVVPIDIPSIYDKTVGADVNDYLLLGFWFDAGSNFDSKTNSLGQQSGTFDIARVQLEAGEMATDFEYRLPGVELASCKRYYQELSPRYRFWNGVGGSTSSFTTLFYNSMRSAPTFTGTPTLSDETDSYTFFDTQNNNAKLQISGNTVGNFQIEWATNDPLKLNSEL